MARAVSLWRIPHDLTETQSEPRGNKTAQVGTKKVEGQLSFHLCSAYCAVLGAYGAPQLHSEEFPSPRFLPHRPF